MISEGCEGTLNLMFDDYPIAWVNNIDIAQKIREYLSENKQKIHDTID